MKFEESKIDIVRITSCDVITDSTPVKTNENDTPFVNNFTIGK